MEKSKLRIAVLDGYTLNPGDLSWSQLESLGQLSLYDHTPPDAVIARAIDADVLVVNKLVLGKKEIAQLPQLRCICVTATGYNNIDLEAARSRQIPVCNAVGYGAASVAQHVFSLLLQWTNQVSDYHQSVQEGQWAKSRDFCYYLDTIPELAGKTFGIYGLGQIGQAVAKIALAFGMHVIAHTRHPEQDLSPIQWVNLEDLFRLSDVLSLHAPLSADNQHLVNRQRLSLMKPSAILINTARGGLIHEADLKWALENRVIAAAALDVLSTEPPKEGNILFEAPNCLITPHIAWASAAARQRLMDITVANVAGFLNGRIQNNVLAC
ncbi:MAG TPA: D-2-hydroxyacid dehydrogenase [Saprospiraceae bacterium]|nr:D-2-hydroxyacid dehydrogenase [Saprospiraceae bacterium]HMQ81332.1 D-2-hydroxyacid dehydrogenase [Saprospiraceae bacterium]